MLKVAFITLGCAKNEVDSEKMQARVLAAGFELTDDPETAFVVVINTCSFITEATEEAIAVILEACDLDAVQRGESKIVVSGCMPSRYGAELESELPEVAAFVTCADEDNIVAVIMGLLSEEQRALLATSGENIAESKLALPTTTRMGGKPWAYLKIADGCDRRCAFCTIPNIKGSYTSVSAKDILAEAEELVDLGVREIVLIAQDSGLWGSDICNVDTPASEAHNLATLLDRLASLHANTWFRVMYLQPQGISDELLAVMAAHDNICNYLDIPLQHANARILREMNRRGSGIEYLQLLARVREFLPDVALRTTVIAGFPSETRAEAEELNRFIEDAAFDYVGVFTYSEEDGTTAGARADQVPMRTRKARTQRLRNTADSVGFTRNEAQLDTMQEVLVCESDEDDEELGFLGRTKKQAPEVDGMVHLQGCRIGDIVIAKITNSYCYDLDAEIVEVKSV